MESCKVDLYSLESRRNPVMSVTIQIKPRLFHYFNIGFFFSALPKFGIVVNF